MVQAVNLGRVPFIIHNSSHSSSVPSFPFLSGSGSDVIDAGTGNDTLFLGGGEDVIAIAAGNGFSTINNFVAGQTQLLLDELTFADLTIAQAGSNTQILFQNDLLASLTTIQASSVTSDSFVV